MADILQIQQNPSSKFSISNRNIELNILLTFKFQILSIKHENPILNSILTIHNLNPISLILPEYNSSENPISILIEERRSLSV